MYNYTYHEIPIIIHNNSTNLDSLLLINCIGGIIYSVCSLFNINIDIIIQDRQYKYIFNIMLLFSSLEIIINIIFLK
jgi:hypothetical protein